MVCSAPRAPGDSGRPRRPGRACARPLKRGVRRHHALVYYFVLIAPIPATLVLLALQLGALARYRHKSFLMLSVATSCGFFYLAGVYGVTYMHSHGETAPDSWFYASAFLLLAQMILGVWGTAWLFRSYGQISSKVSSQGRSSGAA